MKQLLFSILAIFSTNGADIGYNQDDLFRLINGVPQSIINQSEVTENDVTFYQSTRDIPQPTILTPENFSLVDTSKNFKIIIHGYLARYDVPIYLDIKDQYLIKGDYNVILVDWRRVAAENYPQSVEDAKKIGEIIANRISQIPLENVHVVGHSLGAHVAGFAGKALQNMTGNKPARITGLDPAGLLFENAQPTDRLHETDAIFVDIVHTDAGGFGIIKKIGKVDFYPNGGTQVQPGCPTLPSTIAAVPMTNLICGHTKACEFFAKSINNSANKAQNCTNYLTYMLGLCRFNQEIVFGENVDLTAPSGNYYLNLDRNTLL